MAEHNADNLQSELLSFRQNWQEEITNEQGGTQGRRSRHNSEKDAPLTQEERATQLFLEGARYEKEGQLQVAVYYYRQAVHLVPDIEFKIAESQQHADYYGDSDVEEEEEDDGELDPHAGNQLMECMTNSFRLMNMTGLCSPEKPQTATHISVLPTELLSSLFRWVVSKDLDVKSLAQLSLVCKWFYVCARDTEIWKQICLRVWGINCDTALYNNSWRQMYVDRPHVRVDGVYISTNTYIHIGEPTIGSHYKPCHLVEYYKYLRFFADGTVLVYTSADDPQTVVQALNHPPYRDASIQSGFYRLTEGDKISIWYSRVLKPKKDVSARGRANREKPEVREHHFFMTLTLKSGARRRNAQLLWEMYRYEIKNLKTGKSTESDIPFSSFKPFVFSGVRSYLSHSLNSI